MTEQTDETLRAAYRAMDEAYTELLRPAAACPTCGLTRGWRDPDCYDHPAPAATEVGVQP